MIDSPWLMTPPDTATATAASPTSLWLVFECWIDGVLARMARTARRAGPARKVVDLDVHVRVVMDSIVYRTGVEPALEENKTIDQPPLPYH